ncbi:MAG: type IV secretory system conjugative DNA transfer family protein [Candidatus Obscuribacterales bacterium]|nr:type IV secretory system conjugative DNA transfer family protein [Candidatus Obscuribacterales bacterium]
MTEVSIDVEVTAEDVLLTANLLAPITEMPAMAAAALSASRAQDFIYDPGRDELTATIDEPNTIPKSKLANSFTVKISWSVIDAEIDLKPFGEAFQRYANYVQVVLSVRRNEGFKGYAEDCKKKAKTIFHELGRQSVLAINQLHQKGPPADHGSARFAEISELEQQSYVLDANTSSEEASLCFRLGQLDGSTIVVPRRSTEAHVLVVGRPGSGKSRGMFMPNLNERLLTSAIVTEVVSRDFDPPAVFDETAGYREFNGHRVFYFNPVNLSSTRFNIIDFIETVRDALSYAHLIITNTTAKFHIGDQIWVQCETQLLTALLLYARGLRGDGKSIEGGLSNLGYIRSLLRHGPVTVSQFVQSNGIPEARKLFLEFMNNSSDKFRLAVFSGLLSRLNSWLDPAVCTLTEVTDFEMKDLSENLFTFYLSYPIGRSAQYRPIMALALNLLLSFMQRTQFKQPLTLLLDEFAAFGHIPNIDDVQATIRNARIGIVLGFQTLNQLPRIYTKEQAESIYDNTDTKVMFATPAPDLVRRIMASLGRTTQQRISILRNGAVTRHLSGRPLLDESQINGLPKQHAIVIRSGYTPSAFIVKTCDFDKYVEYKTKYPLRTRKEHAVRDQVNSMCTSAKEDMPDQEIADAYAKQYQEKWSAYAKVQAEADSAHSDAERSRLQAHAEQEFAKFRQFVDLSKVQRKNIINAAKRDQELLQQSRPQKTEDSSSKNQTSTPERKSLWEHQAESDDDDEEEKSHGYGY